MPKIFSKNFIIPTAIAALITVFALLASQSGKTFSVKQAKTENPFGNQTSALDLETKKDLTANLSNFLQNQIQNNFSPDSYQKNTLPKAEGLADDFINQILLDSSFNFLDQKPTALKTASDNNAQTVNTYINQVNSITQENLGPWRGQMLNFMKKLDRNFESMGQEIETFAKANKKTAQELSKLEVPSLLEPTAQKQIQLFKTTAEILLAVKNSPSDPLKALIALDQFKELNKKWLDLQIQADQQIKFLTASN